MPSKMYSELMRQLPADYTVPWTYQVQRESPLEIQGHNILVDFVKYIKCDVSLIEGCLAILAELPTGGRRGQAHLSVSSRPCKSDKMMK